MSGWQNATPTPIIAPNQVFDYQQGQDQRWSIKRVTSAGACQGLSIFWVIVKCNGGDFLTWLGPPPEASIQGSNPPKFGKTIDDVIRVMQQQDKVFALPNVSRALNMKWARDRIVTVDSGGGSTQLTATDALTLMQTASPNQIAVEVTKKDGWVFIGFSGAIGANGATGGHAVAARVAKPTVEFFDPNYGEYSFQNVQSFITWFDQSLIRPCYGVTSLATAEMQRFT